jgi:hypothetical protein
MKLAGRPRPLRSSSGTPGGTASPAVPRAPFSFDAPAPPPAGIGVRRRPRREYAKTGRGPLRQEAQATPVRVPPLLRRLSRRRRRSSSRSACGRAIGADTSEGNDIRSLRDWNTKIRSPGNSPPPPPPRGFSQVVRDLKVRLESTVIAAWPRFHFRIGSPAVTLLRPDHAPAVLLAPQNAGAHPPALAWCDRCRFRAAPVVPDAGRSDLVRPRASGRKADEPCRRFTRRRRGWRSSKASSRARYSNPRLIPRIRPRMLMRGRALRAGGQPPRS